MAKLDEQQTSRSRRTKPATHDGPKSELRGRDLIYVDTDDDVTSIVSKIKASTESVVALVPPKRVGVLQSVVNLKLLQRAAKMAQKRLVIVTTDPALINLASGLAIPVAKNINAQAKVPDMVDDEEVSDIIDGSDASNSGLSNRSKRLADDKEISAAVAAIETDDKIKNDLDADGVPDDEKTAKPKSAAKKRPKVPSINSLRKKIIIGGVAGVVLICFLVWALVFAPLATITIKAKTSSVDISRTLSLVPSGDKDAAAGLLQPVVKQKKTNESVKFTATGTKEVGEKAKGTVAFCYNEEPFSGQTGQKNAITLDAGTLLYANGMQFSLDSSIEIQGGQNDDGECETYYSTKATAVNIGEEGNIAQNTAMSVSGYSGLAALAKDDFAGGSKETVKVVQQSDVDKAVAELREKGNGDDARDELKEQMSDSTIVIDDSFNVSQGDVKVSPAVGEEASDQATASVETTYSLVGVDKDDLSDVLDALLDEEVDKDKQKVYSNGLDSVKFSNFQAMDNGYTVKISSSGHVGPVINEDDIKKEAVGKKSEEIKAMISQQDGVEDVNVAMSPFWVSSISSENKIKVNFEIDE